MAAPDDDRTKKQRQRSVAIGLTLGALALLFYVWSMVKMNDQLHDLQAQKLQQDQQQKKSTTP